MLRIEVTDDGATLGKRQSPRSRRSRLPQLL